MEEVKGVVRFTPRAQDKYRFSVSPSRIWLENHKTKHQWECQVKSTSDFAVSQGGMPDEVVMKLLVISLQNAAVGSESDEYHLELTRRNDSDVISLSLALKFDIAGFAWRAQYEFILEPLEVSEMQILSAQMLDMQEGIEYLRTSVAKIQLDQTSALPAVDRALLSGCVFIGVSVRNAFERIHQAMERLCVELKSVS